MNDLAKFIEYLVDGHDKIEELTDGLIDKICKFLGRIKNGRRHKNRWEAAYRKIQ